LEKLNFGSVLCVQEYEVIEEEEEEEEEKRG
jgi:hypothetical protein